MTLRRVKNVPTWKERPTPGQCPIHGCEDATGKVPRWIPGRGWTKFCPGHDPGNLFAPPGPSDVPDSQP